jgi:hypothetical protein
MGIPTRYACYKKEMLSWICEKMVTQESILRAGRFSASSSTVVGKTAPQLTTTRAFQARTVHPPLGTTRRTTHIHRTCLARMRGGAKS